MAPIPVYTNSPINAAKAAGITPQTTAPAEDKHPTADTDTSTPTYTTSPRTLPQQSNSSTPTPTRTIPLQQGPPPPQPGAVPRLPEATGTASFSSTPPPPQAGAGAGAGGSPAPPAPTAAATLPTPPHIPGVSYPPQMAIPPPTQPGYNQRGTSTAAHQPLSQPSSLMMGDGPGGYRQDMAGFAMRYDSGPGFGNVSGSGYGGGGGSGGGGDGEEEGFLESAVRLAKVAGEKLSAAESEVWRRINKEE